MSVFVLGRPKPLRSWDDNVPDLRQNLHEQIFNESVQADKKSRYSLPSGSQTLAPKALEKTTGKGW
jgi:hypothetical protein